MKICFFQAGARHNFFLPRAFFQQGLLQRFYGDLIFKEQGLQAELIRRFPHVRTMRTLARRIVHGISPELLRSHHRGVFSPSLWRDLQNGQFRTRNMVPWKIDDEDRARTDIVYSTYFDAGLTLDHFAQGTKLVSDVIIVPSALKIGNREAIDFPEWGEVVVPEKAVAAHDQFVWSMLARSDRLICPSQAVIEDVASYGEEFRSKCRLSPYGGTITFSGEMVPEPKRVLFAGAVVLRKGPQYLREAAEKVARIDPDIRFVVAGAVSPNARKLLSAPNIEVLGHLAKPAMQREFERADMFLFPSLAEGAAGVVLEALAAGLPVVATRAAGVDFAQDAGVFVPERNSDAIVDAVLSICGDRVLRRKMSSAARDWSSQNSNAAWSARLTAILRELQDSGK